MHLFHMRHWRQVCALVFISTTLAVSVLAGCNRAGNSITVPQDLTTPTGMVSGTPSVTPAGPTPTLNSKQLFSLHVEQTIAVEKTSVALTAKPTWTPGPPPPYTGPTETPRLGLLPGCANANSLEPYMVSCWVGIYNGDIVNVSSGREGRAGDMTQGLVWIYNRNTQESQLIPTPDKVGAVMITSVDGTLFTLVAGDHTPPITYTFDLSTRQWISSPTPMPSVSPSVSVVPTTSPAP